MKNLPYLEVRKRYIDFFQRNNHKEIPSAPLVPEDDPSVLFVNAGMFPLIPFLKGELHPKGTRLTNSQRCLRTGDIDEVGDEFHLTTFEMLGNWSLNDYFKKEAINLSVSFFVEELGFDINRIYASVFEGYEDIPEDNVSISVWKEIFAKYGIDAKVGQGEKIQKYGKKENWWGLESGGPCGPDSEIFYDTGKPTCGPNCHINCNCGKYVEIGNNVFMEYFKDGEKIKSLGRHNVDFGGGLDRIVALLQNVDSVYDTDIHAPIFEEVKKISKVTNLESQRIITDHIKAATWIIMDGITPSRNQQGYILRRLIRRAIRHGRKLGIEGYFTKQIAEICIKQFSPIWIGLEEKREHILQTIEEEEMKFNRTLDNGLRELEKIANDDFDGRKAFQIYETYGLPLELTEEILKEKGVELKNINLFWEAEKAHQEKSRTSSAGLFKGGLADTSEMSTKYHTATHLLLASLRKVLGDHIYQKGSNITAERLRLDFPNNEKLTEEQLKLVENLVNDAIENKLEISFEEVSKDEALQKVPFAAFSEKYGDIVKLYYVGEKEKPFSMEICNGPHVKNTSELGKFKIIKQENVASGIKRIKAILE